MCQPLLLCLSELCHLRSGCNCEPSVLVPGQGSWRMGQKRRSARRSKSIAKRQRPHTSLAASQQMGGLALELPLPPQLPSPTANRVRHDTAAVRATLSLSLSPPPIGGALGVSKVMLICGSQCLVFCATPTNPSFSAAQLAATAATVKGPDGEQGEMLL